MKLRKSIGPVDIDQESQCIKKDRKETITMEKNETQIQEEAMNKLYAFVIEQIKAGTDRSAISQKLVETGIDKGNATDLVELIYAQVLKAAEQEQFTGSSIIPALVGGGLAAVVGGGLWALIAIGTGYVIGFMAWGMGWLTGFAVLLFSRGKRGIPLQIISVISSVLGIAIGKYFIFFHYLKDAVAKQYGLEIASYISILKEEVIHDFMEGIGSMVSGFDILWIILAVITAWRIPKGLGIKLVR